MSVKGNILVVEDSHVNQEIAKRHLMSGGHTLAFADNGKICVELCEQQQFDLVLMDIHMPEMDGYEATRTLVKRGLGGNPPVIGLTAHVDAETKQKCLDAGMVAVLTKPVRKEIILDTVAHWLGGGSAESPTGDSASPEQSIDTETPLDYQAALEDFGDAETLDPVIEYFLLDVSRVAHLFEENIQRENLELIRGEAHRIKGAAGSLFAMPLAAVAARVEALAKSGELLEQGGELKTLLSEFRRLEKHWRSR